ncbi:stress-response a/b barrel domain-containing protein up3, partial [Quercus suber]
DNTHLHRGWCLKARTLFSPSFSNTFSPPKRLPHLKPYTQSPPSKPTTNIKMSLETIEHVVLFKVKDNTDPSKVNAMISYGENFSPARAKGYTLASLAVYPGVSELKAVDSNHEFVNSQKDKVRDYLESVVVVDYVVPSPQSASL